MLCRGMDRAQLDAAYNNLAAVPSFPKLFADWAARSARFRERHLGHLGLAYGDRPRERLDLFLAGNPAAPTLAYIHGGYWQMTQQTRWTNPPHPTLSPHKGWAEREARRLT